MTREPPWSQACENNKRPLLAVLGQHLAATRRVLEIGSGTGQHAVFFAPALPHLTWLPSDLEPNHDGIRAWMERHPAPNLEPPLALDVSRVPWPAVDADAVFSANTAHIMHWPDVVAMFAGVAELLPSAGLFILYGPFRYGERHTSASNAAFDASLRAGDAGMGLRDVHALARLARDGGLEPVADHDMPANNRTLVWRKV